MSTAYLNRLCLLALSSGALIVATGIAQNLSTKEAPQAVRDEHGESPLCDPDLIDGSFTFANLPTGEQIVSLHFQNKGKAACRLRGEASPSFAVDGHSMNVARCWLCDGKGIPSPVAEKQPGNQILLAPGERGALDLQWASTGDSCQWADWVVFSVGWARPTGYLFIPSEWPLHICSQVKSAGYRDDGNSPIIGEVGDGTLRVSATPGVVYSDEKAALHVEVTRPINVAVHPTSCASLYSVRQGALIGTRLEPLFTAGSILLPSYTPEQLKEDTERAWPPWRKDRQRRCQIAGGQVGVDADISAADLANVTHIEWRTAATPGVDPVFLTVATHFNVLDVDTLAPNWGDPVEGIRAGLSVDRASFNMGDRIPLHLRWENVDASMPLAQGECKEPPTLEIQDSQHNVLQTIPIEPMCMGHGWGPSPLEKGKTQRYFIELSTTHTRASRLTSDVVGDLPAPGVYYLVCVWSPRVLDTRKPETGKLMLPHSSGLFGKVYATTRSLRVRIEVEPISSL